ncbi:heat shock protein HslJ [Rhodobacter aestuarii]|uniref:Heat shock protein HslJ n=1 Tax=Rhodobacter aestuarii TaxID=453582 RepID=A0A1N7K8T9_9RHOB|nr:META domain-containing protein [Rhodobacter aestuarii]PTV95812.1 heat shock protein HslJ [Rhodobacter aestuarii]SIS57884.1 Heat shock protein HslJ [Rhodobacter aestuarii]
MRPSLLLVLVLALAACKEEVPKPLTDPLNLLDHASQWHVFDIAGMVVPDGIAVTMTAPEPGVIAGQSGCNRYSGRVEMRENLLHVGALSGTRMMCPPTEMEVEQAFHSTIGRAKGLRLVGETLEFTDLEGKPLIRAHK